MMDVGGPPKRGDLSSAISYIETAIIDVEEELARQTGAGATTQWQIVNAMRRDLLTVRANMNRWEEVRLAAEEDKPTERSGG
jgi:hypothetical protein